MQTITKRGNRAVITNEQNGWFRSCLYVNARSEDHRDWTITSTAANHSTAKDAKRWANKKLAA